MDFSNSTWRLDNGLSDIHVMVAYNERKRNLGKNSALFSSESATGALQFIPLLVLVADGSEEPFSIISVTKDIALQHNGFASVFIV